MKKLFLIKYCLLTYFYSFSQSNFSNEFIGRIYILESQNNFFQFTNKDSLCFYSIEGIGYTDSYVSMRKGIWKVTVDSLFVIEVIKQPDYENVFCNFKYNSEYDYFQEQESFEAYRRWKKVVFKDFEKRICF
jgi:hypothetical protein